MIHVRAFLAGFLSTLVFHQGVLALLHAAGKTARKPFDLHATAPLHVPAVVSLAFWGGVWGIALWLLIGPLHGAAQWLTAALVGAVAPSLVAFLVVFPLKGLPVGGGWKPDLIVGALLLNGAWGIGVALFMRLFGAKG